MNNYYELKYIIGELNEKIGGCIFDFAISPHKNVLELFIESESDRYRLIFSADPENTALFLDSFRPAKKSNVTDFFTAAEGEKIERVDIAEMDRLAYIIFKPDRYLLFKLYGNNPNAYLVSEGPIVDAFKNPGNAVGEKPPEPHSPEFAEEASPNKKPKNQITELNPLLPRNLLKPLIRQHNIDQMEPGEVRDFVRSITDQILHNPQPRVLVNGDTTLWREDILDMETEKSFDSVNNMARHAYRETSYARRLNKKKSDIAEFLKRSLRKKKSQLEELQKADKSLERADQYEKYGHLLMTHAHEEVDAGTAEIEVDDLYEDNQKVSIPLKEDMDISDNAQHYYQKAKESRKSYENAIKRVDTVTDEIATLEKLIGQLEEIDSLKTLDKWRKEHESLLDRFGYGGDEGKQATSPFRKLKIGKYEVWVGKNAKSNDRLIAHAHKEDIWLHARGVAGSHAVIRMGNTADYPPKRVILQAASYAAYYSKARGMKTAPVMYTKLKYVRKPKGAAPGAVKVERENVEMVPPHKPQ